MPRPTLEAGYTKMLSPRRARLILPAAWKTLMRRSWTGGPGRSGSSTASSAPAKPLSLAESFPLQEDCGRR